MSQMFITYQLFAKHCVDTKRTKKENPIKEINKMLEENITRGSSSYEEEATHQEQDKGGRG